MAKKKGEEEAEGAAAEGQKEVKAEKPAEKAEKVEKAEKPAKSGKAEKVVEKTDKTGAVQTEAPDMEKTVEKQDKVETISVTRKLNKKYGKVASIDLKQRDPYIPRAIEAKIREEAKKARAVTPNELAQKYDVRVSAMKKLLFDMEREGLVERVPSSSRVKVFNGKSAA